VPNEALRGLGIGSREAPIPGAVAPMVAVGWWASACVLFTGIYGTARVADSIVIGLLTGASVSGLVEFCMACEPAAIRLIWMIRTRSWHPPGSLRAERRSSGSSEATRPGTLTIGLDLFCDWSRPMEPRYQHGFSTRSGNDGK